MEPLAHMLCQNISQYPGNHDDGHGNRYEPAQFLRNPHADGRGDGFGKEGHVLPVAEMKQRRQSQNACPAGHRPDKNPRQDGNIISPQCLKLLVQRQGKTHGGRGEEITDVFRPLIVGIVIHPKGKQ